jgi:hypothetical protein
MTAAAKDETYGAAHMPADRRLQLQIRQSDSETEASTWSLADMEWVTNQLEREIYGINSCEQKLFKTGFSICLIGFEALWERIGIQSLWKSIEEHVIHFGYSKMHLARHISQSFRGMGSGDNFSTDISEWLHIANVKKAYRSTNTVNYI